MRDADADLTTKPETRNTLFQCPSACERLQGFGNFVEKPFASKASRRSGRGYRDYIKLYGGALGSLLVVVIRVLGLGMVSNTL